MHYCVLVLTKEFPTDEVIEKAMETFNEGKYYEKREEDPSTPRPVFAWDYWQLGGRYCAKLRIDVSGDKFDKALTSRKTLQSKRIKIAGSR